MRKPIPYGEQLLRPECGIQNTTHVFCQNIGIWKHPVIVEQVIKLCGISPMMLLNVSAFGPNVAQSIAIYSERAHHQGDFSLAQSDFVHEWPPLYSRNRSCASGNIIRRKKAEAIGFYNILFFRINYARSGFYLVRGGHAPLRPHFCGILCGHDKLPATSNIVFDLVGCVQRIARKIISRDHNAVTLENLWAHIVREHICSITIRGIWQKIPLAIVK